MFTRRCFLHHHSPAPLAESATAPSCLPPGPVSCGTPGRGYIRECHVVPTWFGVPTPHTAPRTASPQTSFTASPHQIRSTTLAGTPRRQGHVASHLLPSTSVCLRKARVGLTHSGCKFLCCFSKLKSTHLKSPAKHLRVKMNAELERAQHAGPLPRMPASPVGASLSSGCSTSGQLPAIRGLGEQRKMTP